MKQIILTQAQYREVSAKYKAETGRPFLDDYTVVCHTWPGLDKRFGQLVCTNKNFYSEQPYHDWLVENNL